MKNVRIILFIVGLLVIHKVLFAQSGAIKITLKGPLNKRNDIKGFCFLVNINMAKESVETIALPHCINWAYSIKEYDSSENNGVWIIEKFQNNEYSTVRIRTEINDHGGQCYDSLGNELLDTLSVSKPVVFNKSVVGYYDFSQGRYRAKVGISIPRGADTKSPHLYSGWVYFKVKE